MKIAKIVSSNSHLDYAARVIDALDADDTPDASDYGFGQFVSIESGAESIIGVIYDSKLINPEYANYGPRLSPRPALGSFSPDYLNEQGILIGILLLGTLAAGGKPVHGVPKRIVPPGHDVMKCDADVITGFHANGNSETHIHYYPIIVAHAGPFAVPLLDSIITDLCVNCSDIDRQRLGVLKQSLTWQGTFGGMRL